MCGILGVVARTPANQLLYDGLLMLQHRGQDAAGIVTVQGNTFHMHKGLGMVRDVFRTRNMRALDGNMGIGHVRYPTAGSSNSPAEAQPFYVNSPFGIVLAHNGNLTNAEALNQELFLADRRHVNTNSDSEVLLNVLAHELQERAIGHQLDPAEIFSAVFGVHERCQGAYAVIAMIAGYGLLAFRDPYGIRPLVFGSIETDNGTEYMVASESVALDTLGFRLIRDVAPGEAIFIDADGRFYSQRYLSPSSLNPCIFEYVYLARPDSMMNGISVYETRLNMGINLADKISATMHYLDVDVVIPIPESSRPSAMQLANRLGIEFREGFVKNRYVGRTFIMPGQQQRRKSVRQKLNAIEIEFRGKNVLLVDDSIVRGTTSHEIVQMAREAGANRIFFASAAPPVRYPNVYGIDMPTSQELIATGLSDEEICHKIGADYLVFQDLEALKQAITHVDPSVNNFETSCFDGHYITGNVTQDYLSRIESKRKITGLTKPTHATQLDLGLLLAD
ncbi:MAG: amidophosphoribosyltransferase [Nitrosomonas sp.]|nr:amidophosphoribosyltransferase [Nitrosomonas sp.]